MLQTSVEIVNPGGTGRPALVISARPAPLPPRRSFIFRLPSAFPLPKKYTNLRPPVVAFARTPADLPFLPRTLARARVVVFFAISDDLRVLCRPVFGDDLRHVRNIEHHVA